MYVNPRSGDAVPIETAMSDGRIMVDHVTTTRTPEKCHSIGLMTIRTQIDTHEYTIAAAMDTRANQLLSLDQVRHRRLFMCTTCGGSRAALRQVRAGCGQNADP